MASEQIVIARLIFYFVSNKPVQEIKEGVIEVFQRGIHIFSPRRGFCDIFDLHFKNCVQGF